MNNLITRIYDRIFKEPIHFLHVGKTGGSAIKYTLKNIRHKRYRFLFYNHEIKLKDIPEGEKVFFCLRDPITRFISGFNSRKRKGKPLYYTEWTNDEKIAFEIFDKPNDLAEAISSNNKEYREQAYFAMSSICHLNMPYISWFQNKGYLQSRKDDILSILFQEELNECFEELKDTLNLSPQLFLPKNNILNHKTPDKFDTSLSNLGRKNISKWYEKDIELFEFSKHFANTLNN